MCMIPYYSGRSPVRDDSHVLDFHIHLHLEMSNKTERQFSIFKCNTDRKTSLTKQEMDMQKLVGVTGLLNTVVKPSCISFKL